MEGKTLASDVVTKPCALMQSFAEMDALICIPPEEVPLVIHNTDATRTSSSPVSPHN